MQNLLRLIIRFSFQIIFVILEIFALSMVFKKNPLPHARFFEFTQDVNGFFATQTNHFSRFFHLTDENSVLVTENARLRNELARRPLKSSGWDSVTTLSQPGYKYDYIPAQVVNNSVNKQYFCLLFRMCYLTIHLYQYLYFYTQFFVIASGNYVYILALFLFCLLPFF